MKNFSIIILLTLYSFVLLGQNIEIEIRDTFTNQAISLVSAYNPLTLKGSMSNSDGKVKLWNTKGVIRFSHINYYTKEIPLVNLQSIKKVYLVPIQETMDNITIYPKGYLKEKFEKILQKFKKLYDPKPRVLYCTYKESLKHNNKFLRLFQLQLEWWSKSRRFKYHKSFNEQNQFAILNIDFTKKLDVDTHSILIPNFGSRRNYEYFFQLLHPNYIPSYMLNYMEKLSIDMIEENKEQGILKVQISGLIKREGQNAFAFLDSGYLFFDQKTGAIIEAMLYYTDLIPSVVFKKKYNNDTENNLDALFNHWD